MRSKRLITGTLNFSIRSKDSSTSLNKIHSFMELLLHIVNKALISQSDTMCTVQFFEFESSSSRFNNNIITYCRIVSKELVAKLLTFLHD